MKTLTIVLASMSTLMMFCTIICGSWLRAKGADPEGVAFHLKLAIPTLMLTLATIVLLILRVMKG